MVRFFGQNKIFSQITFILILILLGLLLSLFLIKVEAKNEAENNLSHAANCMVKDHYDTSAQQLEMVDLDLRDTNGIVDTDLRSYFNDIKWSGSQWADESTTNMCNGPLVLSTLSSPNSSSSTRPEPPNGLNNELQTIINCAFDKFYNGDLNKFTLPWSGFEEQCGNCSETTEIDNCATKMYRCLESLKYDGEGRWIYNRFHRLWEPPNSYCDGILVPYAEQNETTPLLNSSPNIKEFEISSAQTCWMSKEGPNKGPNLITILNPGNWLPIMYQCQTTTPDGRPIPLHPINLWPIGVRLFAFVLSLLIWLTVAAIIVGIALFALNTAKDVLVLIKKAIVGAVLVILILIFMYAILSTIISLLG